MGREVLVIEREALRGLTKAIAAEHRDSVAAMARTTDGKKCARRLTTRSPRA
jgi:hypothetical protein